jgi:hypothetical protein
MSGWLRLQRSDDDALVQRITRHNLQAKKRRTRIQGLVFFDIYLKSS